MEHTLVRWLTSRTPAGIVAGFRERGFSASWSLPDDLLERAATRLQRELLDYFGSLDVELEREQRFKVLLAGPGP